jgi:hypothetical protein
MEHSFSLWLEFEQYADRYPGPDDDPLCDFCNAQVTVGASTYAMNIWTFAYVERARRSDDNGHSASKPACYLLPPDLLVERLDRATITHAVQDLITTGNLPEAWLVRDA